MYTVHSSAAVCSILTGVLPDVHGEEGDLILLSQRAVSTNGLGDLHTVHTISCNKAYYMNTCDGTVRNDDCIN